MSNAEKRDNSVQKKKQNSLFETKSPRFDESPRNKRPNQSLLKKEYRSMYEPTVQSASKLMLHALPAIQQVKNPLYSERKRSRYFPQTFFGTQSIKKKPKTSSKMKTLQITQSSSKMSYAQYLLVKKNQDSKIAKFGARKSKRNRSSTSKLKSLHTLHTEQNQKEAKQKGYLSELIDDEQLKCLETAPKAITSQLFTQNAKRRNQSSDRVTAVKYYQRLGSEVKEIEKREADHPEEHNISSILAKNYDLGTEGGEINHSTINNSNIEVYVKPLLDDIAIQAERGIQSIDNILKEKELVSGRMFSLLTIEREEFDKLMDKAKKVKTKGMFMSMSSWIAKLMSLLLKNLNEYSERLFQDRQVNTKILRIFRELGIDKDDSKKWKGLYGKIESIFNRIQKVKVDNLIEKKNFEKNLDMINSAMDRILVDKNSEQILKEYKKYKSKNKAEVTKMSDQIAEMEKLIARLDHERLDYRDRNEELVKENERLVEQYLHFKERNIFLEEENEVLGRLKEKYYHVAMMQKMDYEGLTVRVAQRSSQYSKLKQEFEDLKQELTMIFKEKQMIVAANKEEIYKKEELALKLTRKVLPSQTYSFHYRTKSNGLTPVTNLLMFSKSIYVLRPSFFNLVGKKYDKYVQNMKQGGSSKSFDFLLLATLRAILDSKYQDFAYNGTNLMNNSRFPDYVYSWLGEFTVDVKTRKIDRYEQNNDEDNNRLWFLCSIGSYFYKKLWDFLTFQEFLTEKLSMDELYFYLHFRNLLFLGPQLAYRSSTLEVISHVPFERVKNLLQVQFKNADWTNKISNELYVVLNKIEDNTILNSQAVRVVDAYLALRIVLQFFKQEKKLYLGKLKKSWGKHSILGEGDLETNLTFFEFRSFIRDSFRKVTELQTSELFRLAWSFGNGTVTFTSFLSAAYERNIFLQELMLENSASMLLAHAKTFVKHKVDSNKLDEHMNQVLKPAEEDLYKIRKQSFGYGNVHYTAQTVKLIEIMNNTTRFVARKEVIYQGDKLNLIIEVWISILKCIGARRSVYLEASKYGNIMNYRKSDKIREDIAFLFEYFIKHIDMGLLVDGKTPGWVNRALIKLQKKVKRMILRRALDFYDKKNEENK